MKDEIPVLENPFRGEEKPICTRSRAGVLDSKRLVLKRGRELPSQARQCEGSMKPRLTRSGARGGKPSFAIP